MAIAVAPVRVQINRAGTGDGEMLKTIAGAVTKVAVAMMIFEGLTATSIRPNAVTKSIEQKRQPGTAGGAVLLPVLAVQAEAELRFIGSGRSFEELTASSILPNLVIEDFVTRMTPGVRTAPAPRPDQACRAAVVYKVRKIVKAAAEARIAELATPLQKLLANSARLR